ncbi:hypothetical protein [Cetobacterium sp.]
MWSVNQEDEIFDTREEAEKFLEVLIKEGKEKDKIKIKKLG